MAVAIAGGAGVAPAQEVPAGPPAPSYGNFGGIGLMETRTARAAPDGTFALGGSGGGPWERYFLTMQVLPWLEGSFRYSIVDRPHEFRAFHDRSFDFKVGLVSESDYVPKVAVGIQDLVGTGAYAGEYLVASKRYYDFDFSLGLGWGRLAGDTSFENPIGLVLDTFKTRGNANIGRGGTVAFDTWFQGPISPFGGVEYNTPIEGLSLKLEFDPTDYSYEINRSDYEPHTSWNVGVSYRPVSWAETGLSFEHGTTLMFRLNAAFGMHEKGPMEKLAPGPPSPQVRSWAPIRPQSTIVVPPVGMHATASAEPPDGLPSAVSSGAYGATGVELAMAAPNGLDEWERDFFQNGTKVVTERAALTPAEEDEASRVVLDTLVRFKVDPIAARVTGHELTVYIHDPGFREPAKNLGRAVRGAISGAPATVERIVVVSYRRGLEISRVAIVRADFERAVSGQGSAEEVWRHVEVLPTEGSLPDDVIRKPGAYPNFNWGIEPKTRQQFMDPDEPLRYQLYAALHGDLNLWRGLSVGGTLGKHIVGNLDQIKRGAGSKLPHVRSDVAKYMKEGKDSIISLQADQLEDLGGDWYSRVSAGLLEEMYGGVGGEVLYRPNGERWALGVDVYKVWQRDYDMMFKFRDYTVTTGHATLYTDLPFYDLHSEISVGRYLAKDLGVTFNISRRFESGFRIGAFATLTDVPFDVFGEGSFDKGIYFSVPLESLIGGKAANSSYVLRPLTRDGGQMVGSRMRLYDAVGGSQEYDFSRTWSEVLR